MVLPILLDSHTFDPYQWICGVGILTGLHIRKSKTRNQEIFMIDQHDHHFSKNVGVIACIFFLIIVFSSISIAFLLMHKKGQLFRK